MLRFLIGDYAINLMTLGLSPGFVIEHIKQQRNDRGQLENIENTDSNKDGIHKNNLLSENEEIGPNSNKKTRKQKDNQSIGNEIPESAKYAFIPVLKIPEYRVKESIIHENTSLKYRTQQKDENFRFQRFVRPAQRGEQDPGHRYGSGLSNIPKRNERNKILLW